MDDMDAVKQDRKRKQELSEDLEIEILARLPVKSLFRFKCVCKFWYELIAAPDFAGKHIETYKCMQEGCWNGVVCLSLSSVVALWNPATKQFRTIGACSRTKELTISSYGFCFDHIANSFKVVCVTFPCNHNNTADEKNTTTRVNIFTPSTTTWREENLIALFGMSPAFFWVSRGTCGRNYMYWDMKIDYSGRLSDKFILSFDMVDEMFKRIELPPSYDNYCTRLASYKDTIAFFVPRKANCNLPREHFEVWVMNDMLGTSQSWSREIIISPQDDVKFAQGFFIKDDVEMPVVTCYEAPNLWKHLLFDPKTQETTNFPWPELGIEFFQYNESLLSF